MNDWIERALKRLEHFSEQPFGAKLRQAIARELEAARAYGIAPKDRQAALVWLERMERAMDTWSLKHSEIAQPIIDEERKHMALLRRIIGEPEPEPVAVREQDREVGEEFGAASGSETPPTTNEEP